MQDGIKNVERKNLIDPKKILLPLRSLSEEGERFEQFPELSQAKIKEVVFIEPAIRKLMRDEKKRTISMGTF